VPNFLATVKLSQRYADFTIFPIWRLSAILHLWCACLDHGHLLVLITVQNVVGIDAVDPITCMFLDFTRLASGPQNWGFGDSNETHAPIANPPNSAQLGAVPTTHSSYIRVHAVVWTSGRGQTHTYRDRQTHRRGWPQYISRRPWLTRNVTIPSLFSHYHTAMTLHSTVSRLSRRTALQSEHLQEMTGWQWHQLDDTQIICTSLQASNYANSPTPHH